MSQLSNIIAEILNNPNFTTNYSHDPICNYTHIKFFFFFLSTSAAQ